MAIYSGKDMPKEVGRTTMDGEVKSWLKDGPVLGSHEPIHVQRAAHDRFIDTNKPPIGKVEHLGLDGPHGTTRSAAWSRQWRLRDFSACIGKPGAANVQIFEAHDGHPVVRPAVRVLPSIIGLSWFGIGFS